MSALPNGPDHVAVIGGGAIGSAFAAVFADAGAATHVVEPSAARRRELPARFAAQHQAMTRAGLARGPAEAMLSRLELVATPEPARAADLIVEAGPEALEAKQALFATLIAMAPAQTPIVTSSSAITASAIVPEAADRTRCMVAHPGNPPTILRILEIVPTPDTDPVAVERAVAAFGALGFDPTVLGAEVPGFVFNRLQGALLREAYRLVEEGVVDVDGLDRLVRDGLGPRWALCGPFENAELNTPGGIRGHAARMGPAYRAIGEGRGETHCVWSDALVDRVERERRQVLAAEDVPARAAWREAALAELMAARNALKTRTP